MVANGQTKALQLHYQDEFQALVTQKHHYTMAFSEFMKAFTESYTQDNNTHITTTKVVST